MNELAKAWEVAKKAWKHSREKHCAARRKCENCFRKWKESGKKEEEQPPLFPSDYKGNCPVCENELSYPSVPF